MLRQKLIKIYASLASRRAKTKEERRDIKRGVYSRFYRDTPGPYSESQTWQTAQNIIFPKELETAEKLIVIVVPEHNEMSGGIYSFFSIASQMRRLKRLHGFEVVLMTRPNAGQLTYLRQTNFRNSENVFRFSQIVRCKALKTLYLHIPEYAASYFVRSLPPDELKFLKDIERIHINILNQNIKFMPEKDSLGELRSLTESLSQSVAHHAYFSQEIADKYNLPTLLLPAYTDIVQFPGSTFSEKEDLIIYSPDFAAHKKECLARIAEEFPQYELLEIKNITFDQFMDLATRCRFSISFGEGFDGYIAQPILQGGIGFTVFSDEFFPDPHFLAYRNIFKDGDEMINLICSRIREFEGNASLYSSLNSAWQDEYAKLYSFDGYLEQLRKLALRKFEIFPRAFDLM